MVSETKDGAPPPRKENRSEVPNTVLTRRDFLARLPKVELHSHLNGSIPSEKLRNMLINDGWRAEAGSAVLRVEDLLGVHDVATRMKECFKVFDCVYRVMTSVSRMQTAIFAVLDEYRKENTALLELRTTPRAGLAMDDELCNGCEGVRVGTDEDYVDRVIKALDAYDVHQSQTLHSEYMHVKLLVAVGRRMTAEQAERVVDLAVRLNAAAHAEGREPRITGIDFSGDCYSGAWASFEPSLSKARASGLKVSLHVGEKDDNDELAAMLKFQPHRIGHLVFANEANIKLVEALKLPLELCITSNLLTTNWSLHEHHVRQWYGQVEGASYPLTPWLSVPALKHPISINTDDRGVFDTSMLREWLLFIACITTPTSPKAIDAVWFESFGKQPITQEEAVAVITVTYQSIEDAFVNVMTKTAIHKRLADFCEDHKSLLLPKVV